MTHTPALTITERRCLIILQRHAPAGRALARCLGSLYDHIVVTTCPRQTEALLTADDALVSDLICGQRFDDDALDWKPSTGENWMTTGQLLRHMTEACGASCRGFVTGDWGTPEGAMPDETSGEGMLPPAEKMRTLKSAEEARALLE